MSKPIVSVIVPTKNSSNTLAKCLRSLKEQSYSSIEILVIDNFSTDSTPEIAKEYADLFYQVGPERCAQRNYGAQNAQGKYVVFIDSDMYLGKTVIEECCQVMQSNQDCAGIVIPEQSFGKGFWAQCKALERSFYVGVSYMEAARFFPKSLFDKVGGYDESMVSGEDWDLSQRIAQHGSISRVQTFIRHDEQRISLKKTIGKKYYYAKQFASYTLKNENKPSVSKQTSVIGRYRLFFSHPVKLFRNPVLGVGMLFMKTCEFGFGAAGYAASRLGRT